MIRSGRVVYCYFGFNYLVLGQDQRMDRNAKCVPTLVAGKTDGETVR
jgi:hypothetical protein